MSFDTGDNLATDGALLKDVVEMLEGIGFTRHGGLQDRKGYYAWFFNDRHDRFINMGDPWYIVFRDGSTGLTVGIVRDGSVCIFSSIMPDEFIDYIEEKVVLLVLKRKIEANEK